MDGAAATRLGRVVGGLYLCLAVVGSFPLYVRASLISPKSGETTATSIQQSELLFRLSMVSEIGVGLCWGGIAFCLFWLLRPLRPVLSLLFLIMVVFGVAAINANVTYLAALMTVVDNAAPAVAAPTVETLTVLFQRGESVWALWAGLWLIPLGLTLAATRVVPSVLAYGVLLASLGYVLPIAASYVAPETREGLRWLIVPAGLTELTFGVWLLVKSVNVQAYERAGRRLA